MSYAEHWDRPHRPGEHPLWQESDCYWFWDEALRVGGFHRIGQTPAAGTGHVMLYVFEEGGERYRRVEAFGKDRLRRMEASQEVAGSCVEALGEGRMRYAWSEPETEGDLRFVESFYPPRDWSRHGRGAAVQEVVNADGHLECSGRIRGRVRIGDREHEIDALAHRDRSWGPRDVSLVAQHRMFSGTCGPELSFATFVLELRPGGRHAAGFVVREGVETDVRSARILATFDNDGVSVVGGTAELDLEDGSKIAISCRGVQGFASVMGETYLSTDTISRVTVDGVSGFCDLEVANDPRRGAHVPDPASLDLASFETGLSRARSYGS